MRHLRGLLFFTLLAMVLLAGHISVTICSFSDSEVSTDNTFGAGTWTEAIWPQTSKADFEAGVLSNVDSTSSPDNILLALATGEPLKYYTSGSIASQVLDTGASGSRWYKLSWSRSLPENTNITFEVRASDTSFLSTDGSPSWTSVGGTTPVTSGLPSGRYQQWRATLTTTDTASTPILYDVSIHYLY